MINKLILSAFIVTGTLGCNKSDQPVPPVAVDDAITIFPIPPAGWSGTANPYSTTGWVGDMMPYYENGKFELFFLHDATDQTKSQSAGEHPIHKFTSKDLLHFNYGGEMIPYGNVNNAEHLIGTGSVVKAGDTYFFYYTGHNGNSAWVANNPRECVLYATSNDLTTWEKQHDFKLLPDVSAGYERNEFRDPHVFFNEEFNEYWMLVSTRRNGRGVLSLYTTTDPATDEWELQEPLEVADDYLMLECADIFKMGDWYYLLFAEDWSSSPGTRYRMARSSKGPWLVPPNGNDQFDGHQFYAAKTAYDGNNRYAFGWAHRRRPETDQGERTWAGNMIAHQLVQLDDGRLGVKSPNAVQQALSNEQPIGIMRTFGTVNGGQGTYELNGGPAEAGVLLSPIQGRSSWTGSFELMEHNGLVNFAFNYQDQGGTYRIALDIGQNRIIGMNANQEVTRIAYSFEIGKIYQFRLVVEGSIAILYLNDEVALTNRIYSLDGQAWALTATGLTIKLNELKQHN